MSYRIRYEARPRELGRWVGAGVCLAMLAWGVFGLGPVWQQVAAGEGLYEALARFVGETIRGHGL